MGLFTKKVVVITGAGGGIGRSHALQFAREGAKVVVNDLGGSRDGAGKGATMADAVVAAIKEAGGEAVANHDSVSTRKGAEAIIATALNTYGRIDILVNNAGILRDKTLLKMTDEMWQPVIDVHLTGTFLCMQAAARAMAEQGEGGRIINTSSLAGLKGNFGQTNYAAAKAGIYGMTLVGAMELGRNQITVNAVAPVAKTRMTDDISAIPDDMTAEMITPMVMFLASEQAAGVTGRIFGVHGRQIFEYQMKTTDGVRRDTDWTVADIATALPQIESFDAPAPAAAPSTAGTAVAPETPATPRDRLAEVFRRMPEGFLPDKAGGWKAVMHFEIKGAGTYTIKVGDGACTSTEGAEGAPTCVVKTDLETFLGMVDGSVDGQQAFMQGKVTASNIGDMMKYKSCFSKERAEANAPTPASATAATTSAPVQLEPEECVQTLFEIVDQVLPVRDGTPIELDFDLGKTGRWRLNWSSDRTTIQQDPTNDAAGRVKTDAKTLCGIIEGTLDPKEAFNSLAIIATPMNAFFDFVTALRDNDFGAKVAQVLAERPVSVTAELRNETLHGDPILITPEQVALFAKATNDDNPRYADGVVPPLLAVRYHFDLVKKFLGDPRVKVDLMALVHGEQEMIFHQPLEPRDVLSPKVELHRVDHKMSGSLLAVRFRLMRDGELVNESISSYFVRRRDGSDKKDDSKKIERTGVIASPDFEMKMLVRDEQSREYAKASLDENPIHMDDNIAKAAGFKGVILHGLCTLAFAAQAVIKHVGDGDPERLVRIKARFSKPVLMGDELTTRGKIIFREDGLATIEYEVVNQNGVPVISNGEATVRVS